MNGSTHGLTNKRAEDWRDSAACRGEDPDLFAPDGHTGRWLDVIEEAKAVCRRCPVIDRCGQWARENRAEFGVWGGLTEKERAAARRRSVRAKAKVSAEQLPASKPLPETLEELWAQRTKPMPGGHLKWTAYRPVKWRGKSYTPRQIGFRADRGRVPVGRVLRTCVVEGCVLPAHFADNEERARCGTRAGYQRHLKEGTEVCGPCRQANTDADNNLRRTGTTKKAAA